MGAGPVWERALPANFFFTAWLTHHPRRGGLRSAADPHPSWVPSFRQEPRSPGSLGAGPLCRFADPASPGALTARERCAVFAGRARSHRQGPFTQADPLLQIRSPLPRSVPTNEPRGEFRSRVRTPKPEVSSKPAGAGPARECGTEGQAHPSPPGRRVREAA